MRTEIVTSAQNRKIKDLLALVEKSKARSAVGLFVVEGQRELGHCLDGGFIPETLFVCEEVIDSNAKGSRSSGPGTSRVGAEAGHLVENIEGKNGTDALIAKAAVLNPDINVIKIPASLYSKVAYRESTEGIIAEVRSRECCLSGLKLGKNPLVIVLESVEKPGNLGAILRSADAAGADAVIICDPLTDIWNPNLIRSSIGAVFSVPVAVCTCQEAVTFLKKNGIRILTAQLQDSEWYYDCDMTGATAIVMGTESTGLTPIWRSAADEHIKIPMLGRLDSLNVSVSAAILLYEAVRQRHTK